MIPTLHTNRLTLRPYRRTDFDAYAAFAASERAIHMDGPVDRDTAWGWFTNDIASWALHGFGTLAIELSGELVGAVGLVHPPHFPEAECGWFLFDGHEGKGYATEAGRAILDHTFATTDLGSIVSYVGPQNVASMKVAEKLGGIVDPNAATPNNDDAIVYRHHRRPS